MIMRNMSIELCGRFLVVSKKNELDEDRRQLLIIGLGKKCGELSKNRWYNAKRFTDTREKYQQVEKEQLARLKAKAKAGKLMQDE